MAADIFPPSSTVVTGESFTASQLANIGPVTLNLPNTAVTVPTVFLRAFSGAMMSLSGTHSGLRVVFEASHFDGGSSPYRATPAWHMQQGVWIGWDQVPTNGATAYWVPANGAVNVRMRVTNIASGAATGGGMGMHAPSALGTGPVGKWDWVLNVAESTPGNNVHLMQSHTTTTGTDLIARTTGIGSSFTVPAPKRLRIHSYAGSFLAGAGGGRCLVSLRSNLNGATTIANGEILGSWLFGPSAGGVNPDERWSGLASNLTEPIDIYNSGSGSSVGISALGSAGTNGKLNFNLFGYLVG